MHRRLLSLFALLILYPASGLAQPADLPTPQQLFDAARAAMGNPASGVGNIEAHALVDMTDPQLKPTQYKAIVKGAITAEGLGDATFTIIEGEEVVSYGETDGSIWFRAKDGSERTLPAGMAKFVRGHQFHRRILVPELEYGTVMPEVQESEFAGEPVFVVEGTTHAGALLRYYYHRRTKLPVGMHLTVQTDSGPQPMDFVIRDWRTSGDQQLFWRIDITDRDKLFIYRFGRILLLP